MASLTANLRCWLWLFAVKHCRPVDFSLDCPHVVLSSGDIRWEFVAKDGAAHVLLPSRAEIIPLNTFLMDALHYLNQNPDLAEKTTHKKLGDQMRGKLLRSA
jgi:hypothetical protein